jgi:hypothetical protein
MTMIKGFTYADWLDIAGVDDSRRTKRAWQAGRCPISYQTEEAEERRTTNSGPKSPAKGARQ